MEAKRLKRKFTGALLALLITFLAVASATYAWYIYNTSQHTTNVRMAAGAGVNLQIWLISCFRKLFRTACACLNK